LREAFKLREILNLYNTTTSKEINTFNSLIYFNVIEKAQERLLLQEFFSKIDFQTGIKYLGFYMNEKWLWNSRLELAN
jgi:hypothetical protein